MKELIDIIKLIFSGDLREIISKAVGRVNLSKSWQKDIIVQKGSFDKETEYKSQALIGHVMKIMRDKEWDDEEIRTTKYTIYELIRNGIEHCKSQQPTVRVEVEMSSEYVRTKVTDNGAGFDLRGELERQNALQSLSKNSRALGVIYRMNTSLCSNATDHGSITATLAKGYRACRTYRIDNITVYEMNSRVGYDDVYWIDFIARLKRLKVAEKVIIHFNYDVTSRAISDINDSLWPSMDSRCVAVHGQDAKHTNVVVCASHLLLEFVYHLRSYYTVVETIEEAIEQLGGHVPDSGVSSSGSQSTLDIPPPPPSIKIIT